MGLSDVAGVFSRYFVVGFFLPAFFGLVALWQVLTPDFLPDAFEGYGGAEQVLILGGAGLLLGLLLLALNYEIFRLFEGYPLKARRERWYARNVYNWLVGARKNAFQALKDVRDHPQSEPGPRQSAAWNLDSRFGDDENLLLPTRFGNAIQAFEAHSFKRWGLDSIPIWPRIVLLLEDSQREQEANAKSETAFLVNASLLSIILGVLAVIDLAANQPVQWYWVWAYAIPFIAAYVFYRWAALAAVRWGSVVRAAIDLHRLTLYENMGVRRPINFADERDVVAPGVSALLLYGLPPDDALWNAKSSEEKDDESG